MASTDPLRWISLGGEIVGWILGFVLVGYGLSKHFQAPWILVVFSLAGVSMALVRMIRILTRP